jgi:hypothetical protein
MHTPPELDARQLHIWMQSIHDAVSFALPHGDCGIDFKWEIFGIDLDPDLSFELRFTATCLDPRVDRTLLSGSPGGDNLPASDVQAANERLRPFGLAITRTAVKEVEAGNIAGDGAAVRFRVELAIEPLPLDESVTLPR